MEDLIGLKLQAMVGNPARGKDRVDVEALLRANGANVRMDVVRDYAAALGAEHELDEILAAISARPG